jgi:hypothetical protein
MIIVMMMTMTRQISVPGMLKRVVVVALRLMLRKFLDLGSGEATITTTKRGIGLICHLSAPALRPRPRLLEKELLDASLRLLLL